MRTPGDLDPPSPKMTQRFLRTWFSPYVLDPSPAGHQQDDSLRQRITRRRGPGSPGPGHPSGRGPDRSGTADPAGMEGWERDPGARRLPRGSCSILERLSIPTRGKS